jgi:hypothetical protein
LDFLEKVESAIRKAQDNSQDCPICGAGIVVVGADNDGDFYGHACECLLEAILNQKTYDEDYFECSSCPDESELYDPENENLPYIYDDEIFVSEDTQSFNMIPNFKNNYFWNKPYTNFCHNCKKDDGVDSNDKNCVEDPPYGFKCKHCGHSLRTHEDYGEGCTFDMKNKNITWYFENKKRPKLYEKTQFSNKLKPFPNPLF